MESLWIFTFVIQKMAFQFILHRRRDLSLPGGWDGAETQAQGGRGMTSIGDCEELYEN